MTSYNHLQHAPGHWHERDNGGDPRAMSLDSDMEGRKMSAPPPQTQTHQQQQQPQQTQTMYSTAPVNVNVNVEEGAWQGIVSIPRAVSQDEEDEQEMSVSYAGSSSMSSQTYSSRSRSGGFTSPSATIPEDQEALSPLPPVSSVKDTNAESSLQQQQQRQLNISALTQRSTSTSSSLSFAGMGRYFDATTDANGTAYFSAGGGTTLHSSDDNDSGSQDSQQTPTTTTAKQQPSYILETSVAISLSPSSPVRSVGDIFQNTSLTPTRMVARLEPDDESSNHTNNNNNNNNKEEVGNSGNPEKADSNDPKTASEQQSSSANQVVSSSWGSTIHQITEQYSTSVASGSHPPLSSSNHHQSQSQLSASSRQYDDSSWARAGHSQELSSISHDISPIHGSSISRSLALHSSTSNSNSHPAPSSIARSSLFDTQGANEEDDLLNDESTDGSKKVLQQSGQEHVPSTTKDTQKDLHHSLNSDPLYQLQQLSNAASSMNRDHLNGQNPLLSPLPASTGSTDDAPDNNSATAAMMNDTSVNVSLGHYLSSCSTSAQTSRDEQDTAPEPREEGQDRTVLSDIDVSAWTQEHSLPLEPQETNHHQQETEEYARDNEEEHSQLSGLSLQASEPSVVPITPRKTTVDLHLDPNEFASPTTTTKRNSIDVALDESTGFVARIEALQAELIRKDEAMNGLRAHYEEQLEQLHQFTLPLQPHSPYDANNTKYSPGAQNQKLIERNQTLAKEVRFADQTCVELSGRNTALEEQLTMREKELEEVRQEREDLTQKLLSSNHSPGAKTVEKSILQELEQAKEHKLALEQQLHAAYDKLDGNTKDVQAMREEHASELMALRQAIQGEQNGLVEDLKEQINSLSSRYDEQHGVLESKDQDIQQLVSEREHLRGQLQQLSRRVEEGNSVLSKSQEDLKAATQQMEALRRESSSTNWKLQETAQRLQEVTELKDSEAKEKDCIQEQSDYWKSQAEMLQKELDEVTMRSSKGLGQVKVPEDILGRAQQSEQDYRCVEKEFTTQVEKDLAEVHSALSALALQFEAFGDNNAFDHANSEAVGDSNKAPEAKSSAAKINPSLISHYLAYPSQSSGNDMLSPQVIQVLQLILSFTQQHLDVLDKKVATVTTEYGARLTRLYTLVDHIRSSLVFETESDEGDDPENASRGNGTTTREDDNMLDATFAAVTSIPDKKVELMEEARSPQKPAPSNIEIPHDLSSPARDTILDLSKIEAVNSPFYSSEITFSLGSEGGHPIFESLGDNKQANAKRGRPRNLGLQSVQKNVFTEPLECGRKELERLRSTLSTFQKGFWLQRERISSFVESQQKALRDLGAEYSSLAAQEGQLVKDKSKLKSELTKAQQAHNECIAKIERCTLDLEASQKSESRLRSQYKSSCHRIASLEQDVVDMEDRLLDDHPHSKKSPSIDDAKDPHHLRRELAETVKCRDNYSEEMKRLEMELKDLEEAHGNLKISFARANDKLATAFERAENHKALAEELNETQQREARTRNELSHSRRQVQENVTLVNSLDSEKAELQGDKERIEKRLQNLEAEIAVLKDKYQVALSSYDGTAQEQSSLQAELAATKHELERMQAHFEESLTSTEEKLKAATRESQDLRNKLAVARRQKADGGEEMQRLEEAQRLSEDSLEQLKISYATSQNQLAEALERISEYDNLVSEKEYLERQLEEVKESKVVAAQQELDQLREDLGLKIDALTKAQQDADALLKEKENLELRLGEMGDKDSTLKEASQEAMALRAQLADVTKAKDNAADEIDRLQQALAYSEQCIEQLKLSYVECQEKVADAEERAAGLEGLGDEVNRLRDTELQLQQEISAANEDLKAKTEALSAVEATNIEICRQRDEFKLKLDAAEKEVEQSREAVESLQQVSQMQEAMQKLEEEMGRDLKDAYRRNECLSEALKQSDETLEQLKMSYLKVNNELAEKEALLEEFKSASEAAEHLTTHTEEQLMDCRNELEELRNDKIDLANALAEAENEIIAATEEYCEYRHSMEAQLDQKEDAIRAAEEQLENTRNELEDKILHFATEVHTLRREISKALNPANSENDDSSPIDAEAEIQNLKTMVPSLCESLSALVDKSEWSDEHLQQVNQEVAALKSSLQDEKVLSEELGDQLREARSKLDYASEKIQRLRAALDEERTVHHEDQRKFFWSESARETAQERFEKALGIQEEDVGRLFETESQYMDLSSKFARVSEELSTYKERTANALQELKSKEQALVELQTQEDIWKNRCFKLRVYMRKLTEKIQEWETSYHSLRETCEKLQAKRSRSNRTSTGKQTQQSNDVQSRADLVHGQLEENLNQIAIELSNVCW